MPNEDHKPNESYKNLAEINFNNFNRFLSHLPSQIVERLPVNHVEMLSNYANPCGIKFETLSIEIKEKFISALENRFNDYPIQVFSYFPICLSRCDGCRYQIQTLREIERGLNSSSAQYLHDQLLLASSIAESSRGIKNINIIYEGGGTATLQSVEQFRKKWLGIKEIFGFEEQGSATIEGNPLQFCNQKYVSNLILTAREIFCEGWEIRFSIGGFGFDIAGRTEPEVSLLAAIKNVNKVTQKLGIDVNINIDAVYGSIDSCLETHLVRLQKCLDLGVRNFTLYALERSPENQKYLSEYVEEYFGIIDLEVFRSPSSLGGDWISLVESGKCKNVQYLDGRWEKSQDLIGLTGYSLLEIEIDGKIYFVRATTPQLTESVQKLADSIQSEKVELGFTKEGLKSFDKVEIYNSNLKALNLLHYSGRLYKEYITGDQMNEVWQVLLRLGLILNLSGFYSPLLCSGLLVAVKSCIIRSWEKVSIFTKATMSHC
jgi:hypothetical protein